jgi:hypothetical protein
MLPWCVVAGGQPSSCRRPALQPAPLCQLLGEHRHHIQQLGTGRRHVSGLVKTVCSVKLTMSVLYDDLASSMPKAGTRQ